MIATIISFLLIIVGFLIAEFQNAYLGKQEKNSKEYFSIIGVSFTEKDFQRLGFAVFLGIGIMFLLPILLKFTGYDLDGNLIYIITGYSPSLVMFFLKKKLKQKTGIKDLKMKNPPSPPKKQSITGGNPNPDHEEH